MTLGYRNGYGNGGRNGCRNGYRNGVHDWVHDWVLLKTSEYAPNSVLTVNDLQRWVSRVRVNFLFFCIYNYCVSAKK